MSVGFDRGNRTPEHGMTLRQFAIVSGWSLGCGVALWFLLNGWHW